MNIPKELYDSMRYYSKEFVENFSKQIAEVQPIDGNLLKDFLDELGDKTLVITAKEPNNG